MYRLILVFAFCTLNSLLAYKIPDVTLERLSQGFRISIPDSPGVKLVTFNINKNRRFNGYKPGDCSVQARGPVNKLWIYENTLRNIGDDDIIYVWTQVQHNQFVYRCVSKPIAVNQLSISNNYAFRQYDSYCAESISKVQNRHVCKGDLLFEDNFDGGLNLSRWQYEVRVALDINDAEFVLYENEEDNIQITNGMLKLVPTLWNDDKPGTNVKQGVLDLGLRCTSKQNIDECRRQPDGNINNILPPVKTARINTKDFFSFKYGRVDIRAKIPSGDWLFPHSPGVKSVTFNINKNRIFNGYKPGQYSVEARGPINESWIYENTERNFGDEDTIYVWTKVHLGQFIHRLQAEPIAVKELNITTNNEFDSKIPNDDVITTEKPNIRRDDSICAESISKVKNRHVCKGDLLFEDNFDGGLNLSKWQNEVRVALDVGDAEFVLYDNEVENIQVANGMLTIVPTLWNNDKPDTDVKEGTLNLGLRCTSKQRLPQECKRKPDGNIHNILPPVKTARINTKDFFSFKYGRVDIRAKIPSGDWLVPLLLLEPTIYNYDTENYASGQLRIAFARGNNNLQTKDGEPIDGRTLYGGAVLGTVLKLRKEFFVKTRRNTHFANDFHTYSMLWTHKKIILQVDDQEYGSINSGFAQIFSSSQENRNFWKERNFIEPFDQELYITLGVSAGGHGDFPDGIESQNRRKPWSNTDPKAAFKFWKDHEPGISSVFYGFEINEMCPLQMEYVKKATSGYWTMEHTKTQLMTNDNVVLFVMVQQNNDIFKATQKIKIGQGNEFTALRIDDAKLSDECIETNTISTEDGTCKSSETSVNNAVGFCSGQIIFDESFDNSAKLNTSRWSYDIRLRMESLVSEFVVFDNNDMNHFIKDGALNIVPSITAETIRSGSLNLGSRCTAVVNPNRDCSIVANEHFSSLPPVHSTQIHTMKAFSFKHGRVEIRAKLPQGDWILPYMLLQPVSTVVDSEQVSNMRIAFARGNKRLVNSENIEIGGSRLYSGIYSKDGPKYDSTSNIKREEHFGNDFHIYSLTWSKTGILVAVDGENYGEILDGFNTFLEECYLILGVSVGGHREFDDNSRTGPTLTNKPWTNTSPKALVDFWKNKEVWKKTWNGDEALKIDYVRVYAL